MTAMIAVNTRRTLNTKGADAVMMTAEKEAIRNGYRVVIAVVDAWGHVLQLRRIEGARAVEWPLPSPAEFFAALADVFGLTLDDLDADDRARLWGDAQAGQAAYEAAQGSADVAG